MVLIRLPFLVPLSSPPASWLKWASRRNKAYKSRPGNHRHQTGILGASKHASQLCFWHKTCGHLSPLACRRRAELLPPPRTRRQGQAGSGDSANAAETAVLPPTPQAENWRQLITPMSQAPRRVPRQEQPRGLPCPLALQGKPPRPLPRIQATCRVPGPARRALGAAWPRAAAVGAAAPRTARLLGGAGGKRGAERSLPRPACCGLEAEKHGLDSAWEWAASGGADGGGWFPACRGVPWPRVRLDPHPAVTGEKGKGAGPARPPFFHQRRGFCL